MLDLADCLPILFYNCIISLLNVSSHSHNFIFLLFTTNASLLNASLTLPNMLRHNICNRQQIYNRKE